MVKYSLSVFYQFYCKVSRDIMSNIVIIWNSYKNIFLFELSVGQSIFSNFFEKISSCVI